MRSRPWQYVSIPVAAAVVGYVTNYAGVNMLFYPIEWTGKENKTHFFQRLIWRHLPTSCVRYTAKAMARGAFGVGRLAGCGTYEESADGYHHGGRYIDAIGENIGGIREIRCGHDG